jgi:hypothetical protein
MLPAAAISMLLKTCSDLCGDSTMTRASDNDTKLLRCGKCHNFHRARRSYLCDVASDGVGTRSWTMKKLMVDDIDVVILRISEA